MSTQPVIFLAFANSTDAPLNRLHEEEELVRKVLHQRQVSEKHFHVHPESNANLDNLRTYLRNFENQVCIFHYAGHADSEQLFLRSGEAQAAGLAEMLAEQDNLKLVFLNGCSSAGQIKYLLELGVPAVIGTRAPIGDELARDFSKHFYASLEMGATLQKAFEGAAAFAKAGGKSVSAVRAIHWDRMDEEEIDDNLWTLVHDPQKPEILNYKLPGGRKIEIDTEFVPNVGLIEGIWEALQQEGVVLMSPKKIRPRIKRNNILNLLPTTVSENLRHLFITTEMELPRLKQLIKCYEELIELVIVIQLAQLWNLKFKIGEISLPKRAVDELQKFIYLNENERDTFRFIPLLRELQEVLAPYEANFVLEELADISELLEEDKVFVQACTFFDTLRQSLNEGQLDATEYFMNCQRAEKAFTQIITEFAYLAHVKMVTIKRIDVIKYCHTPEAVFEHEVIDRDIHLDGKADLEKKSMHQFLNNQSVLLLKLDDEEKITGSLSMSPFIFDKNAFLPASDRSQIFFFHHFNAQSKTWSYQGIHDLDKKELLEVAEKPFSIIEEQLQAFNQTFLDE